jgi:putative DNA primase/helicase
MSSDSNNIESLDRAHGASDTIISETLDRILSNLETIPMDRIASAKNFDRFVNEWRKYQKRKLLGKTLSFDRVFDSKSMDSDSPSKTQLKVIVSEVLKTTSEIIGFPISYQMGLYWIYTGKYWEKIDNVSLNNFLMTASLRLSIDRFVAQESSFVDKLKLQLELLTGSKSLEMARNLVNFQNGTLVINTDGSVNLREHDSEDQLFYVLPYSYDPDAKCPKWLKFLDEVLPDAALQAILAEFFGSCFSNQKHEKILFLYGSGANGKSVIYEIVRLLFGDPNLSHFSLEEISQESGYYRAKLGQVLLNYAGEISKKANSDILKKIASGEPLSSRKVYKDPSEVLNYCRFAFNGNVLPFGTEFNEGYFRRFLIIPFDVTIPPEKQNQNLPFEIAKSELPAIMNWVIEGLQRLITAGGKFTYSSKSNQALLDYRAETDTVKLFCESIKHENQKEYQSSEIFAKYLDFCIEAKLIPVNNKQFKTEMIKNRYQWTRRSECSYFINLNYTFQ